jgi:hypothetical protein
VKRVGIRVRTEIECAIARGWRIERICRVLDVPPETVQAVWHEMDEAVAPEREGLSVGEVAERAGHLWVRMLIRRARQRAA